MAVILPFEESFYQGEGIEVEYVGHPILDIRSDALRDQRTSSKADLSDPVLALVPGSRTEEVRSLLPVMLSAATLLKKSYPTLRCVIPLAPTIDEEMVIQAVSGFSVPVVLSKKGLYATLRQCRAVIAASGTVTLEIALLGKPMVVVYRLSRISYAVGKRVIKVPFISLVNLVAGRKVVPELIQDDVRAEKMAVETAKLLQDSGERKRMVQDLQEVSQLLGEKGASARAAEIALEMMR